MQDIDFAKLSLKDALDLAIFIEDAAPDCNRTRALMSMQDALDLALDAETKAYEHFNQALPEIQNAEVRELFAELLQEEIEPVDLVKKVMANVPQEAGFDLADFVDAPAGE